MTQEMDYLDEIFHKALEREPMTDRECCDFGRAMLHNPNLAEEFVLTQRIIRDTQNIADESPSPSFADDVMQSLPNLQIHPHALSQPVDHRIVIFRPLVAGAALIACAIILLLLPIDSLYNSYAAPFVQQAWQASASLGDSISMNARALYDGVSKIQIPGSLPAALVITLLGMAIMMNYWFGAKQNEWK